MIISSQSLRALFTGFKTVFQNAFDGAPSDYAKVAMVVSSATKQEEYGWLGTVTRFREWLGDRVVQNLKTHDFTIKNKDFENTVGVDRNDIADDTLGVYTPMLAQLGQDAKTHPDELIFALLAAGFTSACYDGQYFFDTDHPVIGADGQVASVSNFGGGTSTPWYLLDATRAVRPLIFQKRQDYKFISMDKDDDESVFSRKIFRYGVDARVNVGFGLWQLAYASRQSLDPTNFGAAYAALMSIKGDNGKPLGIRPSLLVVPPTLRDAALTITKADIINNTTNVQRGAVDVLVTPWLA
jgi:phage major head subunit gpT-like protein